MTKELPKSPPPKQEVGGILGWIERMGNRIPDITMLFICAFVITCILSAILSQMHFDYIHPSTHEPIAVNNMLDPAALVTLLTKMVTNYTGFPPLGMVIVATLGIGIADGSGYINTGLKKILAVTPKRLITPIVILVGMASHLAPDSGYMIIIPIAAYMFYASGKHPLAGIGASFAGIAGAFAANYTPSAIDPVIQGFTQMAAQIIDPTYEVNVLCNYFYALGSTFIVIAGCWWVTEKVVEPWCRKACPVDADIDVPAQNLSVTPRENRAFYIASAFLVLLLVGLVLALLPEDSILRDPAGNIASFKAPVMQSIVAIIFLLAAAVGVVYGIISGNFRSSKDFTHSMEGDYEDAHSAHRVLLLRRTVHVCVRRVRHRRADCHRGRGVPEVARTAAAGHNLRHHPLRRYAEPHHHLGVGEVGHSRAYLRADAHGRRHRAGTDAGGVPRQRLRRQRLHADVRVLPAHHRLLSEIL